MLLFTYRLTLTLLEFKIQVMTGHAFKKFVMYSYIQFCMTYNTTSLYS